MWPTQQARWQRIVTPTHLHLGRAGRKSFPTASTPAPHDALANITQHSCTRGKINGQPWCRYPHRNGLALIGLGLYARSESSSCGSVPVYLILSVAVSVMEVDAHQTLLMRTADMAVLGTFSLGPDEDARVPAYRDHDECARKLATTLARAK